MGQVLPTFDDCSTPADEDCDGVAASCNPGAEVWVKAFGDPNTNEGESARAVAADSGGNVLFMLTTYGTVDLGGGPLPATGTRDTLLAKYGPAGNHVWSKRYGSGGGPHEGEAIAVDASDNVIIAGAFIGQMDFGGGVLASASNAYDVFVAKLSPAGSHLWSKRFGSQGEQKTPDVAVDASGSVIFGGEFDGTINFGGADLTAVGNGTKDVFVAKLDAAGNHVFSKRFGNTGSENLYGVAVDGAGNILFTGRANGAVDFGAGSVPTDGCYVVKLSPAGAHIWTKIYGGAQGSPNCVGLAVDPAGNVLVAGEFTGTIDIGGGPLVSAGFSDVYVAKLSPAGLHLWSKRFGDSDYQGADSVASDAAGNVLLTGHLLGTVSFGGAPLAGAGGTDVFVAKLDPASNHLFSKRTGDAKTQYGWAVAADPFGFVLVAGTFEGTIDFGGGPHTALQNSFDAFLAKLQP